MARPPESSSPRAAPAVIKLFILLPGHRYPQRLSTRNFSTLPLLWGWMIGCLLFGLYYARQGFVPASRAVIAKAMAWRQPKTPHTGNGIDCTSGSAYTLNPQGNMVSATSLQRFSFPSG